MLSKLLRSIIKASVLTPIHNILAQKLCCQTPIVVVVEATGGTSGIEPDMHIYVQLFGTVMQAIADVSAAYIRKTDNPMLFRVSGCTTLWDLARYFHTDIMPFTDSEIILIAGFIMETHPDLCY